MQHALALAAAQRGLDCDAGDLEGVEINARQRPNSNDSRSAKSSEIGELFAALQKYGGSEQEPHAALHH